MSFDSEKWALSFYGVVDERFSVETDSYRLRIYRDNTIKTLWSATSGDSGEWLQIDLGKKDKVRPNQLVVFFHDEYKIHREHFGRIEILENSSIIEVKKEALRFLKNTHGITFNGKKIKVTVL